MIACPTCGFKNQPGHIFCTRCRAKLNLRRVSERDLLATGESGGRKGIRILLVFVLLVVAALALACFPATPAGWMITKGDLQQARRKIALLEKDLPVPPQVFTEAEVNACLAVDVSSRRTSEAYRLRSVRVQLKPNAAMLSVGATWAPSMAGGARMGPFDITYEMTGVPRIGDDGFSFSVLRGKIGHLPLPGPLVLVLAPRIKEYFQGLWRNYPVIGGIKRVELEDGKLIVFK